MVSPRTRNGLRVRQHAKDLTRDAPSIHPAHIDHITTTFIAHRCTTHQFASTSYHRAVCLAGFGSAAALLVQAASRAHGSPVEEASLVGAALAGYALSDLGSGIFHWSVDNYGGASTPVLGGVIAAFQGHHKEPWTITMREFCNNTYKICLPVIPFLGFALANPNSDPTWDVFWATFATMICLSQQFHAWSHCKR